MKFTNVAVLLLIAATASAQTPGFLGIRAKKSQDPAQCAIIEQVAPGGPAERAGLAPGDVIFRINSVDVDCTNIQKGAPILSGIKPGDRVVFEIHRGGKAIEIAVVAGEIPSPSGPAGQERAHMEAGRAVLQRLIATQEVFTITLKDGGGFEISGKMSQQEADQVRDYFEKKFGEAFFSGSMKTRQQDMYVHFDREKGAYQFELAGPASPAKP